MLRDMRPKAGTGRGSGRGRGRGGRSGHCFLAVKDEPGPF